MEGVEASWAHQTRGPEKGLLAPEIHSLCIFGSIRFSLLEISLLLSPMTPGLAQSGQWGCFRVG